MEAYKSWQVAKAAVKSAADWVANKDRIDSQCRTPYELNKIAVAAEYCGQAYAGATNYHKSPDVLNEALAQVIRANFPQLIQQAMDRLQRRERAMLLACKDELSAALDQIEKAEQVELA